MRYHLPTIACTPVDIINRRAAATGSVGYAMQTAYANYNGHHVGVSFNTYRGYWIAEYHWGERVVIARGSLVDVLRAARDYYSRGDKGATVCVGYPKFWGGTLDRNMPAESVQQFNAICEREGFTFGDEGPHKWWTPKHAACAEAMSDSYRRYFPGLDGIAANLPDDATKADWEAARDAHLRKFRPSFSKAVDPAGVTP